jgi:deazaflavin-dependent oxidoreductase (nitroreductase family)
MRQLHLGPTARSAIRFVARFVNPLTLLVAGRRWMPVVGILEHRGRKSGRTFSTPLGMRPHADSFVMPLTFSEDAAWYRNVIAAGSAVVLYRGREHKVVDPEVIDYPTAAPAFPRYELAQFRLLGISQFLRMRQAPTGASPSTQGERAPLRRAWETQLPPHPPATTRAPLPARA